MPDREFIAVGENIHCTRIYRVGGRYVKKQRDGSYAIPFGKGKSLPIPSIFTEGGDWERGRVRHVAVAVWQGLHGDRGAQENARSYVAHLADLQESNDAAFLDLNVDELSTDTSERKRAIAWAAAVMRESSRVPLSIDSSNLEILEAGLAAAKGGQEKPMVNSVSLERPEAIEIARAAEAVVIAGAAGASSMPSTKEDRLTNFNELMDGLRSAGFALSEIYLDPLIFPCSVDTNNAAVILDTIAALRKTYGPEVHFAPGLSNVSFGMPKRKLINQVFARLCVDRGLDGGIVDPLQINAAILRGLDTTTEAYRLTQAFLLGEDEFGMSFIEAAREGRI
jgi:5-methyltetrahydrofolate--homocysteine methyltransferase